MPSRALTNQTDAAPPVLASHEAVPTSRAMTLARRFFTLPAKTEPVAHLIARADQARDRQDWFAAAKDYAAAIEAGAPGVGLYVQLGHALKEADDYEAAENAYRRFLALRPNDADINLQLGHLFNRQGRIAEAAQWYDRALVLAPEDPDIRHHAGSSRKRLARADIERKRNKAMALVEGRAWHQARFALNELVTIDGEEDLIGILANVTKETGDFEEAEKAYGQYGAYARASAPELIADVELQLGHLHRAAGQAAKALEHYIRARKAHAEWSGEIARSSAYDTIVQARIDDIYTCFWRQT